MTPGASLNTDSYGLYLDDDVTTIIFLSSSLTIPFSCIRNDHLLIACRFPLFPHFAEAPEVTGKQETHIRAYWQPWTWQSCSLNEGLRIKNKGPRRCKAKLIVGTELCVCVCVCVRGRRQGDLFSEEEEEEPWVPGYRRCCSRAETTRLRKLL